MIEYREQWLHTAVEDHLKPMFAAQEFDLPAVRVSTGWPSRGGTSTKKRVVGECWKAEVAEDGVSQIFISPVLASGVEVLAVLVHELVHAWDKGESGHRGSFATACKALGLEGPWTSTHAGVDLTLALEGVVEVLGEYPHSKMTPTIQRKVQSTRMLKVVCPEDGYTIRTTKKWLEVGLPFCPCTAEMELEVKP